MNTFKQTFRINQPCSDTGTVKHRVRPDAANTESQQVQTKKTVLVLGGRGFIGRHIVAQLKTLGANVLIGTRGNHKQSQDRFERKIALHKLNGSKSWQASLDGIDVVINAVGILRQRPGETYEQVHHYALKALASACAEREIRLVHVSALGLDNPVKSRFLSSKLRGENALKQSDADWHIVRPSLVEGDGGYGATWLKRIAAWPIHFAPRNAGGLIAPINANHLGQAISVIALSTDPTNTSSNRIYELGGRKKLTLMDYLGELAERDHNTKAGTRLRFFIPSTLARAISHVCDLLHITPYSFGHYELLKYDNCPRTCRLEELVCLKFNSRKGERSVVKSHLYINITPTGESQNLTIG